MNILAIAQLEDRENLDEQILKQTIQPDRVIYYHDETPAIGIENRRKRIAENHTKLQEIVKAYKPDLVWQLEGDCVLPDNTLERLIGHYIQLRDEDFGYISGIQVGRHGLYCLGAWRNFKFEYNDIVKNKRDAIKRELVAFESVDYKLTGIQEVEATGFYCLLAETDTWLSGKASWNGEPYGPDVVWGRSINKKKYVDMGLHIGHKVKRGIIEPSHISTCNVVFNKVDGKWGFKQL